MEKIEIPIQLDVLREVDKIAKSFHLTASGWIELRLRDMIRTEVARNKVMDIVASKYEQGGIDFSEMSSLVGYLNAKKIKSVVEGVERSFEEVDKTRGT